MSQLDLRSCIEPGVMLSQVSPTSQQTEGRTLELVEIARDDPFFEGVQIVDVSFPDERERIGALVREAGIGLTYCITRVLGRNGWNLSALSDQERRAAVDGARRCLDDARQTAARYVHLVSGPAPPEEADRIKALEGLKESIAALCEAARQEPRLDVIIEPLDVRAHKKATLGFTTEAIDLMRSVQRTADNIGLCLDTAHVTLNGEDPVESLTESMDWLREFHFCNCVDDPEHELYGDRHLPFGEPGVFTVDAVAAVMRGAVEARFFTPERRPRVFCEVLNAEDRPAGEIIQHCRQTLESAWSAMAAQREAPR